MWLTCRHPHWDASVSPDCAHVWIMLLSASSNWQNWQKHTHAHCNYGNILASSSDICLLCQSAFHLAVVNNRKEKSLGKVRLLPPQGKLPQSLNCFPGCRLVLTPCLLRAWQFFHIAFTHPNGCQNGDLVDPFDVSCTQLPASAQIKTDRMIN